jgi:hypothetical protein
VADWATIASAATAAGTLVLAAATYSSVRSANRAARVAEQSLLIGLRPVLVSSHEQDPPIEVGWGDDYRVTLPGGRAVVEETNGVIYLAIGLRNVGSGLAVLRSWTARGGRPEGQPIADVPLRPLEEFQEMQRDLYVPAGDAGYWHSAIRDREDPRVPALSRAIAEHEFIFVDLFYGDHEGGQPTVTRFGLRPGEEDRVWRATAVRHTRL